MCQFLRRTCCIWDGTVTVVGMNLNHGVIRSRCRHGGPLWVEVHHPSPFHLVPIFVPSLPFPVFSFCRVGVFVGLGLQFMDLFR
jgi:hypothetical protein